MNRLPRFDSNTNESEDDYRNFVRALEDVTVAELLQASEEVIAEGKPTGPNQL